MKKNTKQAPSDGAQTNAASAAGATTDPQPHVMAFQVTDAVALRGVLDGYVFKPGAKEIELHFRAAELTESKQGVDCILLRVNPGFSGSLRPLSHAKAEHGVTVTCEISRLPKHDDALPLLDDLVALSATKPGGD